MQVKSTIKLNMPRISQLTRAAVVALEQTAEALDLWRANEIIFMEAGVKPENIHTTNICTMCNHEYLFSHRKVGNERGNMGAFLGLR